MMADVDCPLRPSIVTVFAAVALVAGCPAAPERAPAPTPDLAPAPDLPRGAVNEVAKPASCPAELAGVVPEGSYYLHISDIHLDGFGDTLDRSHPDTQPLLWASTRWALRQVIACNAPAFVLFTGDLPGHFDCSPGHCEIREPSAPGHSAFVHHADNIRTVLDDLAATVGTTPLLYLPGNNDSLGGDYFSFTDAANQTPLSGVEAHYPAVNVAPTCRPAWSGPCVVSQTAHGAVHGYYSVRPVQGLTVIALNTVALGHTYGDLDGASQATVVQEQLTWLEGQLSTLAKGEKVLLAMHIPPGIDAYQDTLFWGPKGSSPSPWQTRFLAAVEGATAQVVGLAYGHTHYDELKRMHGGGRADGPVVEVAVSAPGITTDHQNRPAFKLVSLGADKELTDFVTLHSTANAKTFGTAHYRFREVFGCPADRTTMLDCLAAMKDTTAVAEAAKIIHYADPQKPAKAQDISKAIPLYAGQTP